MDGAMHPGPSEPAGRPGEGLNGSKPVRTPKGASANGAAHASIDDPFAPIGDADRAAAAAIPAGGGEAGDGDDLADTLEVMPYSGPQPPPGAFFHLRYRQPQAVWWYRAATGELIAAAVRYDDPKPDGAIGKAVVPYCYGRRVWTDTQGKLRDKVGWHCKAPPSPRRLYGLDRLAARPDAAVLVCEGEKAADAAAALFPDLVCVTSQGGSKAADKADWTPLRDRRVTIWPDNDAPGSAYAAKVAELVQAAGAASVRIVDVPADWPQGWDLADAPPDAVGPGHLRELLDAGQAPAIVKMPNGFQMTSNGLEVEVKPKDESDKPTWIRIAAPFQVLGATCNDESQAWGVLLRWHDGAGQEHKWAMPRRLLHCKGEEIAGQLEDAGLRCSPEARHRDHLKRFLSQVEVSRRLRCVSRTGWHFAEDGSAVFVLPDGEAFGRGASGIVLQQDRVSASGAYREAGLLADWRAKVAALAVGNDRLVLFVSAAFAGPLLDLVGEMSGGLHLFGNSRAGKSTAVMLAASAWGSPTAGGQMQSWRGTANGLEATAADTSDSVLILDEMGQANANEVGDVVYMLANEAGKQRALRAGGARQRQSWRSFFLSTGEVTLAQKMGEAGRRVMAGLEVRLANIPADAGAGLGVFQNLHGRADAAALAEELRAAAKANHGSAARAFLQRLTADRADRAAELHETIEDMRVAFITKHVAAGADGQVRSVAARFALIAAAGELAVDYGVLPWPHGEATRAAAACFDEWKSSRGGDGSAEDAQALAQVRAFIEAHGESRFTYLVRPLDRNGDPKGDANPPELARTINRVGYRRRMEGGEGWEYLVYPVAWKNEVCKGIDAARTAELLSNKKLLLGWTKRHPAPPVRISGEGQPRVYRVSGAILGGEHDSDGGTDGAG